MSQSRGLLSLFIAILTSPTSIHIENSLYAQGWNPQTLLHEPLELSKPRFYSNSALCASSSAGRPAEFKKSKKWAFHFSFLMRNCFETISHIWIQMRNDHSDGRSIYHGPLRIFLFRSPQFSVDSLNIERYHVSLAPAVKDNTHIHLFAIISAIISTEKYERNTNPACGTAITKVNHFRKTIRLILLN